MNVPNITVVMMTTASVVVTVTPRSRKPSFLGILRTRPNAIAPRIIPPYEMNTSSRKDISGYSPFFRHMLAQPCAMLMAMIRPTMMIAVIQPMQLPDQTYAPSPSSRPM